MGAGTPVLPLRAAAARGESADRAADGFTFPCRTRSRGASRWLLPGLGRTDRDYAAVRALNYLLGETGYAGRLGRALVDSGIAYAVYTTLGVDPDPGPIVIQTNAVDTEEAVRRILSTLQDLSAEGVGDRERREAQGYLLGRLLFRFESASVAAEALAERAHAGAAGEWEGIRHQRPCTDDSGPQPRRRHLLHPLARRDRRRGPLSGPSSFRTG